MHKALVIVPFALDAEGVANRKSQTKAVKLGPDIEFDFKPVTAGPRLGRMRARPITSPA